MSTAPVTDWGTALITSAAAALALLLGAIPKIIGFAVILIIGWIIASALATAVAAILRTVKFNDLAQRAGISGFVQKMGMHTDAAGFLATLVKWFVRLIVLVTAFDALGLPAVSQVLQQILLWLPNLIVALVVLVIAGLVATAFSNLVRGAAAESGLGNPNMLATIARVAVWAFAIVIAVNQIGIATTIINTLFMVTIGSVGVAFALAFGLGGRETAAQIVQNWYRSGQQAAPKLGQAANAASRQAQDGATATRVTSSPSAYTQPPR